MSRALYIKATVDHVVQSCAKMNAAVSAIEALPSGVTRVVLCSGGGAAIVKRQYSKSLVLSVVPRIPLTIASSR